MMKRLIILRGTRLAVVLPYECITRTCTHAHTHKYHSNILRKRCRRVRVYSQKLFPEIVCDMEECVDRILHAISGYSEGGRGVKQNAYARPRGRDCRSLAFLHFSPCTSGQTPDYYYASIVVIIHTSSSHTTLFPFLPQGEPKSSDVFRANSRRSPVCGEGKARKRGRVNIGRDRWAAGQTS